MLAAILNRMIVAGMVVLLHLRQSAKLMSSLRTNTLAHDDFWDPSMTGSQERTD
jgi:hypothetical protein